MTFPHGKAVGVGGWDVGMGMGMGEVRVSPSPSPGGFLPHPHVALQHRIHTWGLERQLDCKTCGPRVGML